MTLTLTVFFHTSALAQDYKNEPEYLALRDSMRFAFNDGDSVRFFPALKALEDYLLEKGDLHAYYTQRCNEIVFNMNRRKLFEAYMLGRKLSRELSKKKLDNEMYMAYNMLGHINTICGNKLAAKRNFRTVIELMKKGGYYESLPPIYMNIVNVEMDEDPEKAMALLDSAQMIAEKYSPDRVFDIETRRAVSYYSTDNMDKFLEGYKAYKEGVAQGKSSVHGRTMEIYYLASQGEYDKAIALAKEELGNDSGNTITMIYEKAGRWKEAYESLRNAYATSDSVNNVSLSNSMMGISDQLAINDMEKASTRNRIIALTIGVILLALLVIALVYIVQTRRRHLKQLSAAYQHALESDKIKTRFIQNVSHEVRTPLNIISGFSQVIADPTLTESVEERQHMALMMQKNANQITNLIDEILGLSLIESSTAIAKEDVVNVNQLLEAVVKEQKEIPSQVTLRIDSELEPDFAFKTNKNMLRRIINALTDNAIKNTEEGSITLKARAVTQTLFLTIEDTGCGIPADQAEHIFERFVKLDSFKQGIGLGLPLSRKLAEQLGGIITLDTNYGPGARFVIALPFEETEKEN